MNRIQEGIRVLIWKKAASIIAGIWGLELKFI